MLSQTDPNNLAEKQNAQQDCEDIFKVAARDEDVVKARTHSSYEVPILQDIYGLTPLDYALGITSHLNNHKGCYKLVSERRSNEIAQ